MLFLFKFKALIELIYPQVELRYLLGAILLPSERLNFVKYLAAVI